MSPPLRFVRFRGQKSLMSCIVRSVSSLPHLDALPPTTSAQVWGSQSQLVEKMLATVIKAEKDAEVAKSASAA